MPRISPKTLSIIADGKTLEVKKQSKKNFALNKDLADPVKFQEFASDPKAFAAKYDLALDADISNAVKAKLTGIKNLDMAREILGSHDPGRVGATLWAVVSGAFSVASAKVAVAF